MEQTKLELTRRPTWVEVNLGNISHNVRQIKKLVGEKVKIMAVVKADAYGHGACQVGKTVLEAGADSLGVATLSEAIELRKCGLTCPILVLGPTTPFQAEKFLKYDVTPTIFTRDVAEALSDWANKYKKRLKVQIKIDTGMWRLGVHYDRALGFIKEVLALGHLEVQGIFSHLATAYRQDKTYSNKQFERFTRVIFALDREKIEIPLKHIASSAAILDLPEMYLDMVRPGIILYGLFPSKEVSHSLDLRPAMSFKTKIVYLKELPADEGISYGQTYIAKRETTVAVLPVGYADGYPRILSNKATVLVNGQRLPVIGTICMDVTMIDVGLLKDVKVGDEVLLFGQQEGTVLPVEEISDICQTINYETVSLVSRRVPRVYV